MKTEKPFHFQKVSTIKGVSGGSGLIYKNNTLHIVSDDSDILYHYRLGDETLHKTILNTSGIEKEVIAKSEKSDFEAVSYWNNNYYIFGSGSATNRFDCVKLNAQFEFTARFSIENLFREMMRFANIAPEDFNIEGVILQDNVALFFNRGNGPAQKNGIILVENWLSDDFKVLGFHPVALPEIDGFPFTFSDAIYFDARIYFIATVEKTTSVYDDGEILGAAFGIMNADTFALLDFQIVTKTYKLEGLALDVVEKNTLRFWLCDDADNGITETHIFQLEIQKQ